MVFSVVQRETHNANKALATASEKLRFELTRPLLSKWRKEESQTLHFSLKLDCVRKRFGGAVDLYRQIASLAS